MSLYDDIGEDKIREVITEFYARAFRDVFIGYLFIGHDQAHLAAQQSEFAIGMLGGPGRYRGKPLVAAHRPLPIKPAHFGRRQVIMRETLADLGVAPAAAEAWLKAEEALRPLILGDPSPCP